MKVPISKSIFTEEDISHVIQPLSDGWVVQGPKVQKFESMWSQFTKAEYSIATTSCTSALFLSIDSLNLEEDDEVIVPALSWISTANVVENVGCKDHKDKAIKKVIIKTKKGKFVFIIYDVS